MKYAYLLVFLFVAACGERVPVDDSSGGLSYREAAMLAGDWLLSKTVEMPEGWAWPDDALRPERISTGFSDGVAGKTWFLLALYRATREPQYLEAVRRSADYLSATLPEALTDLEAFPASSGLYGGVAGVGFVLHEVYKATGEDTYRDAALRCVDLLHRHVQWQGREAYWNNYSDILNGGAGTGLFLLYAAREMNHAPSRTLAVAVGWELINRGLPDHNGLSWPMSEGRDLILPNFSHGAAGIGYFLATLYQETRQSVFLEAAMAASEYLEGIARKEDGGFLVPYGFPDLGWERPYDIGWAHGPAGTARLFYRLGRLTDDDRWEALVEACATGIRQTGLPGPPNPAFGTEAFYLDRRFGTASVAAFFLHRYEETGIAAYLNDVRPITEKLLDWGVLDAVGLWWPLPRYSFMEEAGERAAFTGYFYGAAGYGLLMLQMDAVLDGRPWTHVFLDNPFGVR